MIAFDECSILHTACIITPKAFSFIGELKHKNHKKLESLIKSIREKGERPYRFVPGLIEKNIVTVVNKLVLKYPLMINVLRKEALKSLNKFYTNLNDWGEIPRNKDCTDIQTFFVDNRLELKKEQNIPEIEDCEIIKGYVEYQTENKILISEDEHFWGYKDLILQKFSIKVVEEWNCESILN